MKFLLLILINSSIVQAEENLTLFKDFGLTKSVNFFEEEKIHMNQDCKDNEKNCLSMIKQRIAIMKKPTKKALKGNPASILCQEIGGHSIIYYDKDHNEYDYCKIAKYEMSSWDIYYNLKK